MIQKFLNVQAVRDEENKTIISKKFADYRNDSSVSDYAGRSFLK